MCVDVVDAESDPIAPLVCDRRSSLDDCLGVRVERIHERGLRRRESGESPRTASDV
jgi:hypothetical protein